MFDEYARPQRPLSPEAERILQITNGQLAHCRTTSDVLDDFVAFLVVFSN